MIVIYELILREMPKLELALSRLLCVEVNTRLAGRLSKESDLFDLNERTNERTMIRQQLARWPGRAH